MCFVRGVDGNLRNKKFFILVYFIYSNGVILTEFLVVIVLIELAGRIYVHLNLKEKCFVNVYFQTRVTMKESNYIYSVFTEP